MKITTIAINRIEILFKNRVVDVKKFQEIYLFKMFRNPKQTKNIVIPAIFGRTIFNIPLSI
jgi:hypothetical protein